jgi:uncharacterized protein
VTGEPVRTCVGCRRRAGKEALLRIVRGPDGVVRPDPTGRAAGRGAYVHRDPACIDTAVRRGALARALRAGGDTSGAARLGEALRTAGAVTGETETTETEGR